MDISRKYWNNTLFDLIFRIEEVDSEASKGKRSALPTATILMIISGLSIGALFHSYCEVLEFLIYTLCVPLSFPLIS